MVGTRTQRAKSEPVTSAELADRVAYERARFFAARSKGLLPKKLTPDDWDWRRSIMVLNFVAAVPGLTANLPRFLPNPLTDSPPGFLHTRRVHYFVIGYEFNGVREECIVHDMPCYESILADIGRKAGPMIDRVRGRAGAGNV